MAPADDERGQPHAYDWICSIKGCAVLMSRRWTARMDLEGYAMVPVCFCSFAYVTSTHNVADNCRKPGGQLDVISKNGFVNHLHISRACNLAQMIEVCQGTYPANFIAIQ